MALFSYKLTHDSGFAPNPFGAHLTLATCKPGIRQTKKVGDWVAGFTSGKLCRSPVGEEQLVYLMQVSEKLSIAEYFRDNRFKDKIPNLGAADERSRCGDNIYRPLRPDASTARDFEQLENPNHWDGKVSCSVGEHTRHDTGGRFVLVADKFIYFGEQALFIAPEHRPAVPYGVTRYGKETRDVRRADAFIEFVFAQAPDRSIVAPPRSWPKDDQSWRCDR